jgi:high-affinity nickel permease
LFVLILDGELRQSANLSENDLFKKVHSDIMCRAASASVALVAGAVEILDLRVSLIEMEVEVISAVSAYKQAGKHTGIAVIGLVACYRLCVFASEITV